MDAQENVDANGQGNTGGNTGKGKGARKSKPKPPIEGKGKRSLNLSMPVEDYERFMLHAMRMTNGNISELVCQLGRTHLREFHITRTPNREAS
jgi:hypothetical protein